MGVCIHTAQEISDTVDIDTKSSFGHEFKVEMG